MKKYTAPELLVEVTVKTHIMYTGKYGSDVDMDIFGNYTTEETEE